MVELPGGEFSMGSDNEAMKDARPWHRVRLSPFAIQRTPVTNDQFAAFVRSTRYVTVAERTPRAEDFPGAPPENLVAGSVVFTPPTKPVPLNDHFQWWSYAKGASWRHPSGPDSDLKGRGRHPVVQVAWEDADAYCRWAGGRLPTEAVFEYAARGGLERQRYAWGDTFQPKGRIMANIWQGHFPDENSAADGYEGTSPVGTFPANGYGLYDMAGNVWEWCSDWYRDDAYAAPGDKPAALDPQGPATSRDPAEPGVVKRVMRGGSYLCTDQYCSRYEVGSRGKGAVDTGTNHLGFRCVESRPAKKS
jgi:formylglycine-generating enzyme required for sulfatase activity